MPDLTCSVEGCSLPVAKRGWCAKHYRRWWRHGSIDLPPRPTETERFVAKVDRVSDPDGCWLWISARTPRGYGRFTVNSRKRVAAYRYAYELWVGPIDDGLSIDHLCGNPPCVNPLHLEPVTAAENSRRFHATRTHCKHGHLFDKTNTYIDPRGSRQCRTCNRARTAKHRRNR